MKRPFFLSVILAAAAGPLHGQVVGTEPFTYADGAIANQSGGTGFNYDNFDKVVTTTASNWNAAFGTPLVAGNALTTNNSGAKREYNGPVEGAGGAANDSQDDHERSGAVRGAGRVFYRFTITRAAGVTWSGASSYDFGAERVFFGVPGGNGPITGGLEFGCSGNGANYYSGIPADQATHTIVTVLDFDRNFIGLWLDPGAEDYYDPRDGSNSTDAGGAYNVDNWSTAVRLASSSGGNTTWDDLSVALDPVSVGIKTEVDADGDGLPASWEATYGLDDHDNGSVGESAPGAKDGANGPAGDPDLDTISNLAEYQAGTFPNNSDSDFDGLTDGKEKSIATDPLKSDTDGDHLTDYDEVETHHTNPKLADSDGGGTADFTELMLGTLPIANPSDDPDTRGNMELVGMEFFDSYADGNLAGSSDGSGWDYDNVASVETFTGHTTLKSSWGAIGGTPSVQSGMLLTQESSIKRAFHGGSAETAAVVGEGSGRWREAAAAPGVNGSDVLYLKLNLVRQTGASWSGVSLYDFGAEKIFLGVPSQANPASGLMEFGIQQASGAVVAYSGINPVAGTTYTLVGRYDFAASRVDLWVNPDLSRTEAASPIVATLSITPAQMNATALRLGSGGSAATGWDRLVAGTSWASLSSLPSDSDGDGMPDDFEVLYGFDNNVNDAGLDADGDGSLNLSEYLAGTNPTSADSDGDGLSDGTGETAAKTSPLNPDTDGDGLKDGEEVNLFGTDPTLADTDGDGQSDGGEIQGTGETTSDPLDPADTLGTPLGLIGVENFDYPDGPVADLAGGTHFDYENWLFNGPFVGHTGSGSDWDGTAQVSLGRLVTLESFASREFNGPGEGAGSDLAPTDARLGAVIDDDNHLESVVYFKAVMTRRAGAVLSVLGPDDFDTERLAFGIVDNAGVPQWGIRVGAETSTDGGGLAITADQTYTVVGKLDFSGNLLSLWVNPNLGGDEISNTAQVTRVYTGTNWASAVRFSSTGAGATEWDDVVVANTWQQLSGTRASLPFQLTVVGYDRQTGMLRIAAPGIPAGETYHLRSSTDLKTFTPLVPAFDFDSTTPQPFVIPATMPRFFIRAQDGASPR